jgi:glycosyltransferase involved in cell wall biosynthesis
MRLWHWFLFPKQQCVLAEKIIVPSQNTKRDLCDIYGILDKKIEVIPFGLNADVFSQDLNLEFQKQLEEKYKLPSRYVLFLGTIEPRKNILAIVDGFIESGLAEKGYELVVVGAKGWKNKHVLQKLEQTSGIRYIGCIEAKEKAFFYKGASIFVYPSLYEGFGFPVLEAMASGVPVVTSNRSSLPEVAGGAAYYVNPSNSSEIALALKRFGEESELSQFFIQRGREHREKFCWKKTAEQFLDLL